MSRGQVVDTSASGGLTVKEFWAAVLRQNEVWFNQRQYHRILIDTEITDCVRRAFPDRDAEYWTQVHRVRAAYNRGALQGVQPLHSWQYVRRNGVLQRVTGRGLPTGTAVQIQRQAK